MSSTSHVKEAIRSAEKAIAALQLAQATHQLSRGEANLAAVRIRGAIQGLEEALDGP